MRFLLLGIPLLILLVTESVAKEESPYTDELERFHFYNECLSLPLAIEPFTHDEAEIGLTEERIQTIAESRLRAARL